MSTGSFAGSPLLDLRRKRVVFLEQKAFELIQEKLSAALAEQGFLTPVPMEVENGRAVLFTTGEVGYGLFYEAKEKRFVLRSTTMKNVNEPGTFRQLSVWLFDGKENDLNDAQSIANDFLEIVEGSKRRELVQTAKKKRRKDEENNADPLFFFNRMATVFPELRDEMNEERIVYGQVRPTVFAKEHVAPKVEELAKKYPGSDTLRKLGAIFSDLYAAGDADTRAVIAFGVLNNVKDDGAANAVSALFAEGSDLAKVYPFVRKLIGKKLRPEKVKKEKKKVEARLEN